jgi:hypothetical protein
VCAPNGGSLASRLHRPTSTSANARSQATPNKRHLRHTLLVCIQACEDALRRVAARAATRLAAEAGRGSGARATWATNHCWDSRSLCFGGPGRCACEGGAGGVPKGHAHAENTAGKTASEKGGGGAGWRHRAAPGLNRAGQCHSGTHSTGKRPKWLGVHLPRHSEDCSVPCGPRRAGLCDFAQPPPRWVPFELCCFTLVCLPSPTLGAGLVRFGSGPQCL